MLRRLRKLAKRKILRRFEPLKGAELIWTIGEFAQKRYGDGVTIRRFNRNSLMHDLKVNELRIHLEKSGFADCFESGYAIKMDLARRKHYGSHFIENIPDWIFSLSIKGKSRVVALECEMHFKGKRRMSDLFYNYNDKREFYFLWYVVPTERVKRQIRNSFRESYCYKTRHKDFLLISTFDEFFRDNGEILFNGDERSYTLAGLNAA